MPAPKPNAAARALQAGVLSWLLPGAGHYLLGHRALAIVFFIAVSLPFWTGLAVGGVLNSVNLRTNRILFVAEIGAGGYTVPAYLASRAIERHVLHDLNFSAVPDATRSPAQYDQFVRAAAPYVSYFPESEVAQIYLATAGLLNILVILDAISRAQTGGLPTYHRNLPPEPTPEAAA